MKRLAIILGLLSSAVLAQTTPGPATYVQIRTAPTVGAACTSNQTVWVPSTRRTYCCPSGVWAACDAPADCAANPPVGACNSGQTCVRTDTGALYVCQSSAWVASAITSSGASGTLQASNGSGGLSAVPAIQSVASGNAIKTVARYEIADMDGDGTPETGYLGDYDGDGTIETSDANSLMALLCDVNADGTQDTKRSVWDQDGDGTTDKWCGVIYLPAGLITAMVNGTTPTPINVNYQGLSLIGAGAGSTTIRADFARGTSGGATNTLCGAPNATWGGVAGLININADDINVSDLALVGIGARNSAIADCDGNGTSAGGQDSNAQSGINVAGVSATHRKRITIERVKALNNDRLGMVLNYCDDCKVDKVESAYFGEHAIGLDGLRISVTNSYFHDSQNTANPSAQRGMEIFCNSSGATGGDFKIEGNTFARTPRQIWVFAGPNNCTYKRIAIRNNIFTTTNDPTSSSSNVGFHVAIGGAASSTGVFYDIDVSGNQMDGSQNSAIYIDGATNSINGLRVHDNIIRNTNTVRGSVTGTSAEIGAIRMVSTGVYSGVSIYDNDVTLASPEACGLVMAGTATRLTRNYIHGAVNETQGCKGLVYVCPQATFPLIEDNDFDLDSTSGTTLYSVFIDTPDDGVFNQNRSYMDTATTKYHIGLNAGSDRWVFTRNRWAGGSQCFTGVNNDSDLTVIKDNVCAPTYNSGTQWAMNLYYGTNQVVTGNVVTHQNGATVYGYRFNNTDGVYYNNICSSTATRCYDGSPGNPAQMGMMGWGNGAGGGATAYDTGDEVCKRLGYKTCISCNEIDGADTARTCAATTATAKFQCLCAGP